MHFTVVTPLVDLVLAPKVALAPFWRHRLTPHLLPPPPNHERHTLGGRHKGRGGVAKMTMDHTGEPVMGDPYYDAQWPLLRVAVEQILRDVTGEPFTVALEDAYR